MSEFIPNPAFLQEILRGAELDAHMDGLADQGVAIAQGLVRVDTGELRDSIHKEDGDEPGAKRVVAGTDHWIFNELGTSEMPAQPFLGPVPDALGLHH